MTGSSVVYRLMATFVACSDFVRQGHAHMTCQDGHVKPSFISDPAGKLLLLLVPWFLQSATAVATAEYTTLNLLIYRWGHTTWILQACVCLSIFDLAANNLFSKQTVGNHDYPTLEACCLRLTHDLAHCCVSHPSIAPLVITACPVNVPRTWRQTTPYLYNVLE